MTGPKWPTGPTRTNIEDVRDSFFSVELAECIAVIVGRFAGIVHIPCLGATDVVVKALRSKFTRVQIDLLHIGPQRQETLRFAPME